MKILADENISARLVERLRQEGHGVQYIKASGVLLIRLATLPPLEEIEIVSEVIKTYSDKLLQSFSVIMPRGVRIRPV